MSVRACVCVRRETAVWEKWKKNWKLEKKLETGKPTKASTERGSVHLKKICEGDKFKFIINYIQD